MKSQHNHPELADHPGNVLPEDPTTNRRRGSDDMTELEISEAHADNTILAMTIDQTNHRDVPSPSFSPFEFFLF